MKTIVCSILLGALPFATLAQEAVPVAAPTEAPIADPATVEAEAPALIRSAQGAELADWLWTHRVIVVFADSPNDPRFVQQMAFLQGDLDAWQERDALILTDTDPAARLEVRQELRARGFMLVVLGKDGKVVLRKPAPWDAREISRSIDKLPLRKQEIAEQ